MRLGSDDELTQLLKESGLSADSDLLQERPHVRCLVQLCADLRCRANPDALNSDYINDGGMSGSAFKLLGPPEQQAYLQGLQDAICCSFSLRSPGGLGTVDQMLSYRSLPGVASIKAHSHVLLLLASRAQEDSSYVAGLVEDNLIRQQAIAESKHAQNNKLSRLRRTTDGPKLQIKPYDGPGKAHKLVSAQSLPSLQSGKKPLKSVLKNPALAEVPNQRPAQKPRQKSPQNKANPFLDDYSFLGDESRKKREILSEYEEKSNMENLKLSSRLFFQTEVKWRDPQDMGDLASNHNATMRSTSRAGAMMMGGQAALTGSKSMGALSSTLKANQGLTPSSKSKDHHNHHHHHGMDGLHSSQAMAMRELSWTLVPELKPKSKKQELLDNVANDLKALMNVGPGPATQEKTPGPAGEAENAINEFSKFVEEKFDADINRVFKSLDSNGNGQLTVNELLVSMTTLRFINSTIPGRTVADIHRLFKALDVNHGGDISIKEFKATFGERLAARHRALKENASNAHPGVIEMIYFLQEKCLGNLPNAFAELDQNGNGRVNEKEWIAGLQFMGYINPKIPGHGPEEMKEVFQALDDNGGGSISLREFQKFFGPKLKERMRALHGDDAVREEPAIDKALVDNIRHGVSKAKGVRDFYGHHVTLQALDAISP